VDKFDALQIFVRVVEKGSFSAVAKERGIGQPAVSKQISALEDELGTELIHRTSRSIALTESGRDLRVCFAHSRDRSSHVCPPPHGVKAGCVFCLLPRLGS
jgi:predicted methyltransferase